MRNLSELPGAQPPGRVYSIDVYGSEKGYADTDELILRGREQYKQEHGEADYVGYAIGTLCALEPRRIKTISETALTSFLVQQHGFVLPQPESIRLTGYPMSATSQNYRVIYAFTEDSDTNSQRLELTADGHYDFVNLKANQLPEMEGEANIAHVEGMERVLTADCVALLLDGKTLGE